MTDKSSQKIKHHNQNINQLSQNIQTIQNTENNSNQQKKTDTKNKNKIQKENQSTSTDQIPNEETKNYYLRCLNCSLIPFMTLNPETHKVDIECNAGHKFSMEVSEYLKKGFTKNFLNLSCNKCKTKINQDNEKNFIYCKQCNELLCIKCVRNHNTLFHNNSKNNNWGISLEKFDTTCEKHNEGFDFYCYTCHKNICQNCYEESHKNHIIVDLDDVDLKRKQLKRIKDKLIKEKDIIQKLHDFIKNVLKELEKEIEQIIKEKKYELIFKENVIKTYDNKIDNFNIIKNVKSLFFLNNPMEFTENYSNFQKLEYFYNYINNIPEQNEENDDDSFEMSVSKELQIKSNYKQKSVPKQLSQNSFFTEKSEKSQNKIKHKKRFLNNITNEYYSINEEDDDFDNTSKKRKFKSLLHRKKNNDIDSEKEISENKNNIKSQRNKKDLEKLNNEIENKLFNKNIYNKGKRNHDSEVILIGNYTNNNPEIENKSKNQNLSTNDKNSKTKNEESLSINDSGTEVKNQQNNTNEIKQNLKNNNSKGLIVVNTSRKKVNVQNNNIERVKSDGTFENENNENKENNTKNNKIANNNLTNNKIPINKKTNDNKSNNWSIFNNDNINIIPNKIEKNEKTEKEINIENKQPKNINNNNNNSNNNKNNNNIEPNNKENIEKPTETNIVTRFSKQNLNNTSNNNNNNNNPINKNNNNKVNIKKYVPPKFNNPQSRTVAEFMPKGSEFSIKEINNGICSLLEFDSNYFAVGYLFGEIDIYDSNSITCLFSIMEHKERINNMTLLKDKSILTQSFDYSMKKIRISTLDKTYFVEFIFDDFDGVVYKCIELNHTINLISISFGGCISIWQKLQNKKYEMIKQQEVVDEELYDIMQTNNKEYIISTDVCLRFFEIDNYQNTNTIYNLDFIQKTNNIVKINNNTLAILLTKEIGIVDLNKKNIVKKFEIIGGKLEFINVLIKDNSLLISLCNNINKDNSKLIFKQYDVKDNKIELKAEREDKIQKKTNKDYFRINSVLQLGNGNIVVGISGSEEQKPIGIISLFEH